jgi:hypothetical protein
MEAGALFKSLYSLHKLQMGKYARVFVSGKTFLLYVITLPYWLNS